MKLRLKRLVELMSMPDQSSTQIGGNTTVYGVSSYLCKLKFVLFAQIFRLQIMYAGVGVEIIYPSRADESVHL